jgi:hypothetical protein
MVAGGAERRPPGRYAFVARTAVPYAQISVQVLPSSEVSPMR